MKKIGLIIVLVFILTNLIINRKSQEVKIKLNFPGIERGLYTTGEKFELRDIINEEILWEVYQSKNLNYSFENFKRSLYIRQNEISFNSSLENIKNGKENIYNQGNFILTSSLPLFEGENIHIDILDEFINKKLIFKMKSAKLGEMNKVHFEEYFDLTEKVLLLKRKNRNLVEYLEEKKGKVNLYEQSKFEDALLEQKLYEKIDLLRIENQIKNAKLVKKSKNVIAVKLEEIKDLELKNRKYQGEFEVLSILIKKYKPENNQLVINRNLEEKLYEVSNEKKYYTDLIEKITKINVEIARISEEIKYLKEEIKLIKEDKELTLAIEIELESLKNFFNEKIDKINTFIENENKRYYNNILEVEQVESVKEYNVFLSLSLSLISGFLYLIISTAINFLKKIRENEVKYV